MQGAEPPARVSEAPAAHQVNIVDLQTRVIGEPDPVYAMHFELEAPAGRAAQVGVGLRAFCVDVTGHPRPAPAPGWWCCSAPSWWPRARRRWPGRAA